MLLTPYGPHMLGPGACGRYFAEGSEVRGTRSRPLLAEFAFACTCPPARNHRRAAGTEAMLGARVGVGCGL